MKSTANSLMLSLLLLPAPGGGDAARAQDLPLNLYDSGSTGADGAFDPVFDGLTLSGVPAGTTFSFQGTTMNVDVPMPDDGVFNFTTINVPPNTRVRFKPNARNTPVIWLASGNVTIAGQVDVSAEGTRLAAGAPVSSLISGPGGYYGGPIRTPGNGPNRTHPLTGGPGEIGWPMTGGSGGGSDDNVENGGGGGGVFYLASSGAVQFAPTNSLSSKIELGGRVGGRVDNSAGNFGYSGRGGVAAVIANEISGYVHISGGQSRGHALRHNYTGAFNQRGFLFTLRGLALPASAPEARFLTIGGVNVPADYTSANLVQLTSGTGVQFVIRTAGLPAGISFKATLQSLTTDGTTTGSATTVDFPPTFGTTTTATSSTTIDLNSGVTFITAKANNDINFVMAPKWNDDPLNRVMIAVNEQGRTDVRFETRNGAVLSLEAALKLAWEQRKWDFLRQFGALGS